MENEEKNIRYIGVARNRVLRCKKSLQRTPVLAVNWDWRGIGEKGGIDGFAETEGVMREKLSDPNCIGSAWRIWKVENVVGKKGGESVCKHGGGVSKLVTVASLLTFLN